MSSASSPQNPLTIPEILLKIFNLSTRKELKACRLVCRQWSRLVTKVFDSRDLVQISILSEPPVEWEKEDLPLDLQLFQNVYNPGFTTKTRIDLPCRPRTIQLDELGEFLEKSSCREWPCGNLVIDWTILLSPTFTHFLDLHGHSIKNISILMNPNESWSRRGEGGSDDTDPQGEASACLKAFYSMLVNKLSRLQRLTFPELPTKWRRIWDDFENILNSTPNDFDPLKEYLQINKKRLEISHSDQWFMYENPQSIVLPQILFYIHRQLSPFITVKFNDWQHYAKFGSSFHVSSGEKEGGGLYIHSLAKYGRFNEGVEEFIMNLERLSCMTANLKHLSIDFSDFYKYPHHLTSQTAHHLTRILESCANSLNSFHLKCVKKVMSRFRIPVPLRKVHRLGIWYDGEIEKVTEEENENFPRFWTNFMKLRKTFPNLSVIQFTMDGFQWDEYLDFLEEEEEMPSVKKLVVRGYERKWWTQKCFTHFGKMCPRLETLDIQHSACGLEFHEFLRLIWKNFEGIRTLQCNSVRLSVETHSVAKMDSALCGISEEECIRLRRKGGGEVDKCEREFPSIVDMRSLTQLGLTFDGRTLIEFVEAAISSGKEVSLISNVSLQHGFDLLPKVRVKVGVNKYEPFHYDGNEEQFVLHLDEDFTWALSKTLFENRTTNSKKVVNEVRPGLEYSSQFKKTMKLAASHLCSSMLFAIALLLWLTFCTNVNREVTSISENIFDLFVICVGVHWMIGWGPGTLVMSLPWVFPCAMKMRRHSCWAEVHYADPITETVLWCRLLLQREPPIH